MSILNLAKCHFLNLIFAGFSMLNFFWDTSAARHVSTRVTTYKTLNINDLSNIVVEGVSKLINEATLLTNYK